MYFNEINALVFKEAHQERLRRAERERFIEETWRSNQAQRQSLLLKWLRFFSFKWRWQRPGQTESGKTSHRRLVRGSQNVRINS